MGIRQKLEDNVVVVVSIVAIGGLSAGWGACEKVRIVVLEKELADQAQKLKDGTVAVEPYRRQIDELVSNTKRLEVELDKSKGNLAEWQQALESLKVANGKLQQNLNLYASNCSVLGELRKIEANKGIMEYTLASAYRQDSEKTGIEDYKRQVGEYQERLISLQSKLTCEPKQ